MVVDFLKSNRLSRVLPTLFLLFLVSLATSRAGAQSVPELPKSDRSGDTPEMTIKMVSAAGVPSLVGKESIRLSSLNGKLLLLDVFSSTCPHCVEHAPHVAEIYSQYRQRGLNVLSLATDNQDRSEAVKAFIAANKVNYPVGFLTAEVIAYFLDSRNHGVPQMVLFGSNGKMVKRLIGWNEQNSQELKAAIEAELPKAATRTR